MKRFKKKKRRSGVMSNFGLKLLNSMLVSINLATGIWVLQTCGDLKYVGFGISMFAEVFIFAMMIDND